jgi:hypothetical protein
MILVAYRPSFYFPETVVGVVKKGGTVVQY